MDKPSKRAHAVLNKTLELFVFSRHVYRYRISDIQGIQPQIADHIRSENAELQRRISKAEKAAVGAPVGGGGSLVGTLYQARRATISRKKLLILHEMEMEGVRQEVLNIPSHSRT